MNLTALHAEIVFACDFVILVGSKSQLDSRLVRNGPNGTRKRKSTSFENDICGYKNSSAGRPKRVAGRSKKAKTVHFEWLAAPPPPRA